jgi:hypothetical protein
MTTRTVSLDEVRKQSLEDIFRDVIEHQEALTVRLPQGQGVTIQPLPQLQPLPVLEGRVPKNWKNEIYGE